MALQLGLFALGAGRGEMEWVLLPVLLFLCGGSLHPLLAVMISSGDYTMLAGYDPAAAYDKKKLETLVRALDLWVQVTNLSVSLVAVPIGIAASETGFVVLIAAQVIGLPGAIGCVQYKYGRNLVTACSTLAVSGQEGQKVRDIQTHQIKPLIWWSGLFLAQFFLAFFCVGVFHISNNSPGAAAQLVIMLPGGCMGIAFLLGRTSRAKRMAARGEEWRMNKSGVALLLGAVLLMILQVMAAAFMQGGGSW